MISLTFSSHFPLYIKVFALKENTAFWSKHDPFIMSSAPKRPPIRFESQHPASWLEHGKGFLDKETKKVVLECFNCWVIFLFFLDSEIPPKLQKNCWQLEKEAGQTSKREGSITLPNLQHLSRVAAEADLTERGNNYNIWWILALCSHGHDTT